MLAGSDTYWPYSIWYCFSGTDPETRQIKPEKWCQVINSMLWVDLYMIHPRMYKLVSMVHKIEELLVTLMLAVIGSEFVYEIDFFF